MKRNKLIIGALGVVSVALSVWVGSSLNKEDVVAKYVATRGSLDEHPSANEYQDWLKTKMIDVETNEVITSERLKEITEAHRMQPKALTVNWREHGPDNIAGRTRAVHVDYTNQLRIWSGGVTGGLYKSENRANLWRRVDNFPGNQFISSIAQDADGNVYVATGSVNEGSTWTGNGMFVTSDAGETWDLVPGTDNFSRINQVVGSRFTKDIFLTTNQGLRKYNHSTGELEDVPGYGSTSARSLAISKDGEIIVCSDASPRTFVSTDGGVTWENRSGGQPGQIASSSIARIEYAISNKKPDGTYSIYASTVNSSFQSGSNNQGQWISLNSGETWHRHTPATAANVGNGVIDFRDQGTWNNVCSFDPTDPKRVIVGGIDLHEWKQVIDNPPSGGWNQISLWFVDQTNELYVHADNHVLTWDDDNRLFIGNDGGVQISLDMANTFYPANRGYNITQFFKIAYDREGAVLGGTQDNGSLYNNHKNSTYQEFRQVSGGDGFSAVISYFNPNIMITSSQYNSLHRSSDAGQTTTPYLPDWPSNTYGATGQPGGDHPFHTMIFLGEHYDTNSEDSVTFIPQSSYNVGDIVKVPSMATGDTIMYETPENIYFSDTVLYEPSLTYTEYVVRDSMTSIVYDLGLFPAVPFNASSSVSPPQIGDSLLIDGPIGQDTVWVAEVTSYDFHRALGPRPGDTLDLLRDTLIRDIPWDTLTVQDPFQSWFLVSTTRNGGELWGTRDALRLAVAEPQWALIARDLGGSAVDVEFSEDLNHIFVCGGPFISSTDLNINGPIHRIDSLGSVYTSDPDFIDKVDVRQPTHVTTKTRIGGSSFNAHGIGIDPRNPDVLVATSGFNGNVFRSNDATSSSPTFTNVGSQGGLAFYDVIVDRDDNDILFAATNMGVSVSENGGATWNDVTHPSFSGVPCYHIMQSWRTWEEGNKRSGEVYVGTHGRGIWSTEAVLSVANNATDNSSTEWAKKENNIKVFPNPSRGEATVRVNLKQSGNAVVMLFDLAGMLVKTVEANGLVEGENDIKFDASDLLEGTYLIKVNAQHQVETTKFIKY